MAGADMMQLADEHGRGRVPVPLWNVRLEVFLFEITGKDVVVAGLIERIRSSAATELCVATDRRVLDPQRVGSPAEVDIEIAERCARRSFGRNRYCIVAAASL